MNMATRHKSRGLRPAADSSSQTEANPFLSLPALVTEQILNYLHMSGLKHMRLVCHSTKVWVDRPRYLRKLPLYIKNEERLNGLVGSASTTSGITGWTHATISTPMLSHSSLSLFFKACKVSLESVKIGDNGDVEHVGLGLKRQIESHSRTAHLFTNVLCHLGPNLRSLRLYGKFAVSKEDAPALTLCTVRLPSLLLLEFVSVQSMHTEGSEVNLFMAAMLKMCPNLTTLKLPIMNWGKTIEEDPPTATREETQNILCQELHPLIAYLKNAATRTSTESRRRVCVQLTFDTDFCPFGVYIHINQSTLLELAEVSRPLGGMLLNVPDAALPTKAQAALLTQPQLANLNSSVASVLCKWELTSIQSSAYVPPESKIVVRCALGFSDTDLDNLSTFQLKDSLNISSIGVQGRCDWSDPDIGIDASERSNLNRQLFRVVRPTVEHLQLGYDRNRPPIATTAPHLQTCFPNLKTVSLTSNSGSLYTTQVVIRLPCTVQKLDIYDSDLTDFCFTGGHLGTKDYEPMHLRMPNLTELSLRMCGMSTMSNYIFRSILKHMSLKVLTLIPDDNACEITFQDGLDSLMNGRLRDSLENLECFIPTDTSEEQMTKHFSGFQRLKTCCLSHMTR